MTKVQSPNTTLPISTVSRGIVGEEDDDFEKQLASFIETEEKKDEEINQESSNNTMTEKGETDQLEKERYVNEDTDTEDPYSFTSDQQRAMDELLAQREEEDFIGEEDPPEYNVKERLLQLNAELFNDPTPLDNNHRDVRIKFKDNLVDLVAPPPEFSEDEAEPTVSIKSLQDNNKENVDSAASSDNNKNTSLSQKNKKYVLERDGKFEVLTTDEMTSTERALYVDNAIDNQTYAKFSRTVNTNNNSNNQTRQPSPPTKPRPATATSSTTRRNVRPSSSKPRPRSAATPLNNSSPLDNFSYRSPYALSEQDKSHFKQQAKLLEEKRREEEETRKQQEKEKAENMASIYNAWLDKKIEEDKRKKKEEQDKKKEKPEDKQKNSENSSDSDSSEAVYQTKLNEEVFTSWVKGKQTQQKKEKLLKKRQEQEMKEGVVIHNKEDVEKTFKRWLRRKNTEIRRKRNAERAKVRYLRLASRKSRKSQALARAINQSQSYKYVDYNY